MEGVLKNVMHATHSKPNNVKKGDIILISQTKNTLKNDEKPIRWIMDFVSCEKDTENLSKKIWGNEWKFLIRGENLRSIEPFDIDDVQVSDKNYNPVVTHCKVEEADEGKILEWIHESLPIEEEEDTEVIPSEFENGSELNPQEYLEKLDSEYANTPEFEKKVVNAIKRPSAISNKIKELYGYECMICGYPGFEKKSGSRYAEVHHMIELNKQAPRSLQSWNTIVVCPTCHRKLHYGKVKSEFLNPGWRLNIDGEEVILK